MVRRGRKGEDWKRVSDGGKRGKGEDWKRGSDGGKEEEGVRDGKREREG